MSRHHQVPLDLDNEADICDSDNVVTVVHGVPSMIGIILLSVQLRYRGLESMY